MKPLGYGMGFPFKVEMFSLQITRCSTEQKVFLQFSISFPKRFIWSGAVTITLVWYFFRDHWIHWGFQGNCDITRPSIVPFYCSNLSVKIPSLWKFNYIHCAKSTSECLPDLSILTLPLRWLFRNNIFTISRPTKHISFKEGDEKSQRNSRK